MNPPYNFKGVGNGVTIHPFAHFVGAQYIELGDFSMYDSGVMIFARDETRFGMHVHIGCGASIQGGGRLAMGDFSGLSAGVRLFTGNDDYLGGAMTNPTVPAEFRSVSRSFIEIGAHCVIGANSVVLPGVKIGEGAVVGALSLVKHDLEPWTVYAGTPARAIKKRPHQTIKQYEHDLRVLRRVPR